MPASLNQLLPSTKARRMMLIPLALLVVIALSYLLFSKPSKETLLKEVTSQLMEEKFEQLYEKASDGVHLNVSKEEFVRRMKIAATKMKAIDENLNFKSDRDVEMALAYNEDDSISIRAIRKLEKGEKAATVLIYWDNKAKFNDLSVLPKNGTSDEYQVHGVSHQHLYIGNRMIE